MDLLRDKTLVRCLTTILVAVVIGLTALFISGKSADAYRVIQLITSGVVAITTTLGIFLKINKHDDRLERLEEHTLSAGNVAQGNSDKLDSLTNGALKSKLLEALDEIFSENSK